MITVAIIGILAAIAIPAYQNYLARAQVSEAIGLLSGTKTPVEEYYSNNGSFPMAVTDLEDLGVRTSGRYTLSLEPAASLANGNEYWIKATMRGTGNVNGNIAGKSVLISYYTNTQTWVCNNNGTDTIDNAYLPSACRS